MAECEVVARKWGHSLGVTLPKEFVEQTGIKENEKLKIFVVRESMTLQNLFGKFKFKKSAQQMKDESRRELYDQ